MCDRPYGGGWSWLKVCPRQRSWIDMSGRRLERMVSHLVSNLLRPHFSCVLPVGDDVRVIRRNHQDEHFLSFCSIQKYRKRWIIKYPHPPQDSHIRTESVLNIWRLTSPSPGIPHVTMNKRGLAWKASHELTVAVPSPRHTAGVRVASIRDDR